MDEILVGALGPTPPELGIGDTFVSLRSPAHTWRIGFVRSRTRFATARCARIERPSFPAWPRPIYRVIEDPFLNRRAIRRTRPDRATRAARTGRGRHRVARHRRSRRCCAPRRWRRPGVSRARRSAVDIGVCMSPVDQDRRGARRQPLLNAERVRHPNGHVVKPRIAGKTDRWRAPRAIVAADDDAVAHHRAAKQFGSGKLLCRFEGGDSRRLREPRHHPAVRAVRRLSDPAAEGEPRAADEVQKLRH